MNKLVMAGALTLLALSGCYTSVFATPLIAAEPKAMHVINKDRPVILAQSADAELRVQQLEEQLRQLNGRVEEMSFQILQMQEQMRKAQEDNEFRFQDLEKGTKKSGLSTKPDDGTDVANTSGEQSPDASALDESVDNGGAAANADPGLGQPAVDLGSVKFDSNGNVIGADASQPADGADSMETVIENNQQTASADNPDALYQGAYEQILAGDYSGAEGQFRAYINSQPEGAKIADANFWLGESQYSQGKYNEAAKTFLNAYKTYGKSQKAPEMLLKLAMSLAALDSKDTACATLREVTKTYPKASRAIVSKVASEQKRLAC